MNAAFHVGPRKVTATTIAQSMGSSLSGVFFRVSSIGTQDKHSSLNGRGSQAFRISAAQSH